MPRVLMAVAALVLLAVTQHVLARQLPDLAGDRAHAADPIPNLPPPPKVSPPPTSPEAVAFMKNMRQCTSMAELTAPSPLPNLASCYLGLVPAQKPLDRSLPALSATSYYPGVPALVPDLSIPVAEATDRTGGVIVNDSTRRATAAATGGRSAQAMS